MTTTTKARRGAPALKVEATPTLQLNVARSALVDALTAVAAIANPKSVLPILTCTLVDVTVDGVTLTATDYDHTIRVPLAAERVVGEFARFAVPARRMLDIAKALPAGAVVQLRLTGGRVLVSAGTSRFEVVTMPADEFPDTESVALTDVGELPGAEFAAALRLTAPCASTEMSRQALLGVCLEFSATGESSAIALDGALLGKVPFSAPASEARPCVLQRSTAVAIARIAADTETVTLAVGAGRVRVTTPAATLTARLHEAQFPNYQQFLTAARDHVAVLSRAELLATVQRVGLSCGIGLEDRIRFAWSSEAVTLDGEGNGIGRSSDQLACRYTPAVAGADLVIWLNPGHLERTLKVLRTEEIELRLGTNKTPVLFREIGVPTPAIALLAPINPPL